MDRKSVEKELEEFDRIVSDSIMYPEHGHPLVRLADATVSKVRVLKIVRDTICEADPRGEECKSAKLFLKTINELSRD